MVERRALAEADAPAVRPHYGKTNAGNATMVQKFSHDPTKFEGVPSPAHHETCLALPSGSVDLTAIRPGTRVAELDTGDAAQPPFQCRCE